MSAVFIVYGEDKESNDSAPSKSRLTTQDFVEALECFLGIVQDEEAGSLEWSS